MRGEARERPVDQLLRRRDTKDLRRAARSLDRRGVARERAGVGRGGARPCFAPAGGKENDLLPRSDRGRAGAREGASVAEVLAVDADHARVLVGGVGLDELRRLDVGLVAEGGEARDADAVLGGEEAQLEREVAALRDDSDRPRSERVGADIELGRSVVDAEAVRTDHHGTRGPDALDDGDLASLAGVVDLAEPGRDRDDRLRACRERVVDRLLEGELRQGNDDEIWLAGELRKRSVRLTTEDLPALPVDEPDVTPMRSAQGSGGDPLAPLRRVVRGAENGHRAWIEERPQVAHGGSVREPDELRRIPTLACERSNPVPSAVSTMDRP